MTLYYLVASASENEVVTWLSYAKLAGHGLGWLDAGCSGASRGKKEEKV